MNRIDAEKILLEWVESPGLKKHCLCVALVMEAIARQCNQDPDTFYITGLLHDADWEKYPSQHPIMIVESLQKAGEIKIAYAISAHGTEWNKPHLSILDRSLVAVDELTGLIYAIAKIRPEGLGSLTIESVIKKFNKENFASGVDRNEVKRGLKILGVELEQMIYFIIGTLQPHSLEIGLPPIDNWIDKNLLNLEIKPF